MCPMLSYLRITRDTRLPVTVGQPDPLNTRMPRPIRTGQLNVRGALESVDTPVARSVKDWVWTAKSLLISVLFAGSP